MNKDRRARIAALADRITEIREALDAIKDEEQEYRDNMPASIGDGSKGQAADEVIGNLEEAIQALDEAFRNTDDAKGE